MSEDKISDRLQSIDNKLERVKSDTNNINRILTLGNSALIIQELWKAVGKSEIRAAILHFTKDDVSAGDLAERVGIAPENLDFVVNDGIVSF